MSGVLPVFDADQVRSRLPMATCIDLLTELHASISRGEVTLPLRSSVPLPYAPEGSNALLVMPGALPDPAVFGAKLLSIYPGNGKAEPPAPVIQGHVLLFDGSGGAPLALVDAASLTAIRTAAASGAATRALARPKASSLALLGYGVQAASHLEAMRAVRPISEVRIWGPDDHKAAAFAERHATADLEVQAVPSAETAVREADVICAVTASTTPVIEGRWLTAGCHLNLVGAHSPQTREADGETLARARVFTEITEFALAEAGDLLLAMAEGVLAQDAIAGEIGSVFAGDLIGREQDDQITLYKNLGNVAQDLVAAYHVSQS
ncbi:MAG: ornithine cyclodeaminase family protein [Gammaproteobacteria bacterium]|nr:MAG: ornithine cyclodeaminase family protein [Gammaproteobacteria bacterium]